jgi:hypothetical protein
VGVVEKAREKIDRCVDGDGLGDIDERRRVFEPKSEEAVVDRGLVVVGRKERALKARLKEAVEACACDVLVTLGAASRRMVVKALLDSSASSSHREWFCAFCNSPPTGHVVDSGRHRVEDTLDHPSTYATHLE